jgi:hypothetical protein
MKRKAGEMSKEWEEGATATGSTGTTGSAGTTGTTGGYSTRRAYTEKAQEYSQTVADTATAARDYTTDRGRYDEADEEDELSKAVEEAVADVERTRIMMQRDQAEIEQLKSDTRMLISRLLAA